MEPYIQFVTALLQQAIKDAQSGSTDHSRAAWRWLRADPDCTDFCDWVEIDHERLILALEANGAGAA